MYTRFTPGPDGTYQRRAVESPVPAGRTEAQPAPTPQPQKPAAPDLRTRLTKLLPQELELGDVLVLLISLLLLVESEEDFQGILITAAAYFLL